MHSVQNECLHFSSVLGLFIASRQIEHFVVSLSFISSKVTHKKAFYYRSFRWPYISELKIDAMTRHLTALTETNTSWSQDFSCYSPVGGWKITLLLLWFVYEMGACFRSLRLFCPVVVHWHGIRSFILGTVRYFTMSLVQENAKINYYQVNKAK